MVKSKGRGKIMKKTDKIIAAFLVSMGVYSASQAVQYVASLSHGEKGSLEMVAKSSLNGVILCSSTVSRVPGSDGDEDVKRA